MDKTVPVPTESGTPAWLPKFKELRELGVPVVRICKEIGVPRSTLYATLAAIEKRAA